MADVYDFFGVNNQGQITQERFPRNVSMGDTRAELEQEQRRLTRQRQYYYGFKRIVPRPANFVELRETYNRIQGYIDDLEEELIRREERNIMNLVQRQGNETFTGSEQNPLPQGVYKEYFQDFLAKRLGQGLSYKGKKHGFIRHIARMGKGLTLH
jgi:hypothetical protein